MPNRFKNRRFYIIYWLLHTEISKMVTFSRFTLILYSFFQQFHLKKFSVILLSIRSYPFIETFWIIISFLFSLFSIKKTRTKYDFRFSKTELLGCEKMTATLTDENKSLEGKEKAEVLLKFTSNYFRNGQPTRIGPG